MWLSHTTIRKTIAGEQEESDPIIVWHGLNVPLIAIQFPNHEIGSMRV